MEFFFSVLQMMLLYSQDNYFVSINNPGLTLFLVSALHAIFTLLIVLLLEKLLYNTEIL